MRPCPHGVRQTPAVGFLPMPGGAARVRAYAGRNATPFRGLPDSRLKSLIGRERPACRCSIDDLALFLYRQKLRVARLQAGLEAGREGRISFRIGGKTGRTSYSVNVGIEEAPRRSARWRKVVTQGPPANVGIGGCEPPPPSTAKDNPVWASGYPRWANFGAPLLRQKSMTWRAGSNHPATNTDAGVNRRPLCNDLRWSDRRSGHVQPLFLPDRAG